MHNNAHEVRAHAGSVPETPTVRAADTRTPRVVLKLGSQLLTGGSASLDPHRMAAIAEAVAAAPDTQVVIVSSGAVAAGFASLGHRHPPTRVRDRQAAAAVGQGRLMHRWAEAFASVGRDVAQVLLTNDCLTDRRRYVAARQALGALLQAGIVPIVNENDTVSVAEIGVGDNDNLAASTAALVDATLLSLLTDVPGVLSGDPAVDPDAAVIEYAASAAELRRLCFKKTSAHSKGGMHTKLEAAERAGRYGIPTVIASGTDPVAISAVLQGKAAGTYIAASERPLGARRHWIAVQKGLVGALVVDDGAVHAIRNRASLLPKGVVSIRGHFRKGDLVAVVDDQGVEHARGIVRLDAREVEQVRGMHTEEARFALGPDRGHVVIRPDRMVMTREEGAL